MFTRGYEESRAKIKKSARFSRSCFNCKFYFQAEDDIEEMCQNPNVLEYDMMVENNSICCVYWQQFLPDEEPPKKTGRNVLD